VAYAVTADEALLAQSGNRASDRYIERAADLLLPVALRDLIGA
jgi:hypothetical protein